MKSLFLAISLMLFATLANAENTCRMKIQGVDTWPWKVAQPWRDIQGIWKLNTDEGEIFFKFRISASMNRRKILLIDKIIDGNCAKPTATGVGYIDLQERNAIRAVISDEKVRYQLKLAVFDTMDLPSSLLSDIESCGQQVIGISVLEVIGRTNKTDSFPRYSGIGTEEADSENLMLKKVSNSLDSICKKPSGRP